MRNAGLLAALIGTVLLAAGCGSSSPPSRATSHGASGSASTPSPSATPSTTPGATRSRPAKVLVVIEENHSYAQMKDGMPFLAALSGTYGYATHWTALTHPSEPNYLGIVGGSTFGITDDKPPASHTSDLGSATSVFGQALAAGKTAATYAESMPQNCYATDYPDPSSGTPRYAVRHNPWVFFPKEHARCLAHDWPLPQFAQDIGRNALPNVGFLIPDLTHDAHDGDLAAADDWLRQQLTPVLQSRDFTSGKLVVVLTADEDDYKSGNNVLTTVLSTALSHKVVDNPLTHYSLTRFIAQVLGVTPLGNGRAAPDLLAAFGL